MITHGIMGRPVPVLQREPQNLPPPPPKAGSKLEPNPWNDWAKWGAQGPTPPTPPAPPPGSKGNQGGVATSSGSAWLASASDDTMQVDDKKEERPSSKTPKGSRHKWCHSWSKHGTCMYGTRCRYAYTHTTPHGPPPLDPSALEDTDSGEDDQDLMWPQHQSNAPQSSGNNSARSNMYHGARLAAPRGWAPEVELSTMPTWNDKPFIICKHYGDAAEVTAALSCIPLRI